VIDFTTTATATGENTVDTAVLAAVDLRSGENLVAVEIHQESITSSDVSFDFELIGTPQTTIQLRLATFGADHVLYWDDNNAHLESTIALGPNASWSPADSAGPFTIPMDGSARFYRLVR